MVLSMWPLFYLHSFLFICFNWGTLSCPLEERKETNKFVSIYSFGKVGPQDLYASGDLKTKKKGYYYSLLVQQKSYHLSSSCSHRMTQGAHAY